MSTERVVVDTGVLLAAADADDHWHDQASSIIEARPADQVVLPVPVATEAAWLIGSRLGPATEAAFVASVAAGEFTLAELTQADWARPGVRVLYTNDPDDLGHLLDAADGNRPRVVTC